MPGIRSWEKKQRKEKISPFSVSSEPNDKETFPLMGEKHLLQSIVKQVVEVKGVSLWK